MRKLLSVWLLCLIVWNGAFGAFGGVLLCLHGDLSVHVDTELEAGGTCDAPHLSDEFSPCLAESESCVDIELSGQLLPPARLDEVETAWELPDQSLVGFILLSDAVLRVDRAGFRSSWSARAPPLVTAQSVQVAQLIQLRV